MSGITDLLLKQLSRRDDLQQRVEINGDYIRELADLLRADPEAVFDPIGVIKAGREYLVYDGYQRIAAHEMAGRKVIRAKVQDGTLRDAILLSTAANKAHGLRRTNEDKRRAVATLLDDPEWSTWENRRIARHVGVDEGLVRKMRRERAADNPHPEPDNASGLMDGDDFEGLSPQGKIRLLQRIEERARREREAEERRAAAAAQAVALEDREPDQVLALDLPPELFEAIERVARRKGREVQDEIRATLKKAYLRKKRRR